MLSPVGYLDPYDFPPLEQAKNLSFIGACVCTVAMVIFITLKADPVPPAIAAGTFALFYYGCDVIEKIGMIAAAGIPITSEAVK